MTRQTLTRPPADTDAAAAAAARFAASAPADVRVTTLETPVGPLLAAVTDRGLAALSYEDWTGGATRS